METKRIDEANAHLHQGGFVNFGGFFIRPMGPFGKGNQGGGHDHKINHLMNVVRGKVRVKWKNPANGEEGVVEVLVPSKLSIRAEFWHEFEVLEDDTFWECWFSRAEAIAVYADEPQLLELLKKYEAVGQTIDWTS